MQIHPKKQIKATVDGLFSALGKSFETEPVQSLNLSFEGIENDFHAGYTRKSGGREPWYPRGTKMRNERQVTIVARDELKAAAQEMGLDDIAPEWIGANITLNGVPNLSMLPASTLIFFEGGVTLKVDLQNAPCRLAGGSIARAVGRSDDQDLILSFKDAAKRRRGLTVWVEKPGVVEMGEAATLRIPEQWIYA